MKDKIKIALAEDHLIVRQGFVALLNGYEEFLVVYDVNNGKELLDAMHNFLLTATNPLSNVYKRVQTIRSVWRAQWGKRKY